MFQNQLIKFDIVRDVKRNWFLVQFLPFWIAFDCYNHFFSILIRSEPPLYFAKTKIPFSPENLAMRGTERHFAGNFSGKLPPPNRPLCVYHRHEIVFNNNKILIYSHLPFRSSSSFARFAIIYVCRRINTRRKKTGEEMLCIFSCW